jgi:ribosomal protein S18 acetylase RimI-like enzyme
MSTSVTLRPIRPEDEPFLYKVYASTREEELAPVGWSDSEKEAFLRMQFNAQHRYYQEQFPDANYDVILFKKKPAGRMYVHRRFDEIRIVDIALLSEYRNAGIGTGLLKALLAEAAVEDKPVRIHVEKQNPALRLYQRLGFVKTHDSDAYLLMEWTPSEAHGADRAQIERPDRSKKRLRPAERRKP